MVNRKDTEWRIKLSSEKVEPTAVVVAPPPPPPIRYRMSSDSLITHTSRLTLPTLAITANSWNGLGVLGFAPPPKYVMKIPTEVIDDGIKTDLMFSSYNNYRNLYDRLRLRCLARKKLPAPPDLINRLLIHGEIR